MTTIKGTYFYKGKRAYKYETTISDADTFNPQWYYVQVINPEGNKTIVYWNFREHGIEESIRLYIENLAAFRRAKPV